METGIDLLFEQYIRDVMEEIGAKVYLAMIFLPNLTTMYLYSTISSVKLWLALEFILA